MLGTSRLIRSTALVLIAVLALTACGQPDETSAWANETAKTVCNSHSANLSDHAVIKSGGESILVSGTIWPEAADDILGATRVGGGDAVPGLDPAAGITPDRVVCLRYQSTPIVECPDGSTIDESSTKIEASLHSIALASEIGATEVYGSERCPLTSETSATSQRTAGRADIYDFDQVLCDLAACVLDDDISATLTALRADDPRSEVCGFTNPFIDGVIELEDGGPVYVAHELGFRGSMIETEPAFDVETDRTLCLSAGSSQDQVSCGEYVLEGQYLGGIEVRRHGIDVNATWFEGDSVEPAASTSSVYYSDCDDEISVVTTTYGSSSVGTRNLDDRTSYSTLLPEHVVSIAEDLENWALVNGAASTLSTSDCTALATMPALEVLQRQLDHYDDIDGSPFEAPDGLLDDVDDLQTLTGAAFAGLDDESPLFTPVFELWYVAHFSWPLIATWADPNDPDATDEDFELMLLGMPARVGLVTVAEPAFVTRHETVERLLQIHADHC